MKKRSASQSAFFHSRVVIGLILCSAGVLLALAALNKSGAETPATKIVTSQPGTWTATGSMNVARAGFTSTLLPNGKVLVAGGCTQPFVLCHDGIASAELYDPSTGGWTPTGSMTTPRVSHTATLLPSGKVLVAGGEDDVVGRSSAELYDPSAGTWTLTGNMNTPRVAHTATLITSGPLSGMVLVAGGSSVCAGCLPVLASAELYDPSTGIWSYTGSMTLARAFGNQSSAALHDGSVLVVGGVTCCPYHLFNEAERYDAATQTWTPTSAKTTTANEATMLLPDGRVLVAGGARGTQPNIVNVATAELFDSSTGTWTDTASMSTDRSGHTLTLLESGQVLVAGGASGGWGVCNDLTSSELYDSSTGTWFLTGSMIVARNRLIATLLPNGQVLAAGGADCAGNRLSSAELYTPPSGDGICLAPPSGLVSWWSGDRTTDDMQGINPGELVGGASYKRGMVGPGFVFDGLNDYVQVGDTPTLKMTTAMTLECWIFPTISQSQLIGIIANREGEYEFARNPGPDGDIWWAFANIDPGWVGISTGFVAPLASWTHIAITYDNGLITSYGNGVQVHQYQGSGPIGDVAPTLNDFRIGNRQDFSWPFAGIIDEFKIYNRALSSSEVAAIYAAGSKGNCKPKLLVASIDPSYQVRSRGFLISTSILIQDENGVGMADALAQIKTTLPSGSVLNFPVTTDATGQATISFGTGDSGLYKFKVRRVTHPTREYDPSLNIETFDTLLIP